MRVRVSVLSFAIMVGILSSGDDVAAQEPGQADEVRIVQELAALNRTMTEIASLLKAQAHRSELDLLLKRVELAQSTIAPREQQLEAARIELTKLSQQDARIQASFEELDERERRAGQPGSTVSDAQIEQARRQLETHARLLKDQVRSAQQRVIDLENELAEQRRTLATWEEEIDRRLGLR